MLRKAGLLIYLAVNISALCLSFATHAQQLNRVYRIGFLEAGTPSANQHFLNAFKSGLLELGYVDGKNIVVDVRWAEGHSERFPRLIAELIDLRPDVIVVASGPAADAAKSALTSIPIVFVGVSDPVGRGLLTNLAHPGGNLTGVSDSVGPGLIAKAIELLKDIDPGASRMAILWTPGGNPQQRVNESEAAVRALGMTPVPLAVRDFPGLDEAFVKMRQQHVDALVVLTGPLTLQHRDAIVNLAAAHRIPACYQYTEFARAGGLVAYSASVPALFHRAAIYVDKIFKGASAGDLPVEQPIKFELIVNLKAAKELGLTVPQTLLLRADEVIQ